MASLYYRPTPDAWFVSVSYKGADGQRRQRRRQFRTKELAEVYMAENGLARSSRGSHHSRSVDEVIAVLAERSALTDDGCLVWIEELTNAGYGRLTWRPSSDLFVPGAHRISYHLAVGPIPEGMVIDHLCRNRACILPEHLEVVTQRENVLRSPIAIGALNAAKTHCPSGHPYSPENTYTYRSPKRSTTGRICKTCAAAHARRYYLRKKASA